MLFVDAMGRLNPCQRFLWFKIQSKNVLTMALTQNRLKLMIPFWAVYAPSSGVCQHRRSLKPPSISIEHPSQTLAVRIVQLRENISHLIIPAEREREKEIQYLIAKFSSFMTHGCHEQTIFQSLKQQKSRYILEFNSTWVGGRRDRTSNFNFIHTRSKHKSFSLIAKRGDNVIAKLSKNTLLEPDHYDSVQVCFFIWFPTSTLLLNLLSFSIFRINA